MQQTAEEEKIAKIDNIGKRYEGQLATVMDADESSNNGQSPVKPALDSPL